MLKPIQQRDLEKNRWIKIVMTVVLGVICLSMVMFLIPGLSTGTLNGTATDSLATISGQDISLVDAQQQFSLETRTQSIPPMLRPIYAKQIVDGMIYRRALQIEADRLGVTITPDEERERIKEILPTAFSGDTWLKDRYESDVRDRMGLSVAEFESELRNAMLEEKFRQMVTDGITVSDAEIRQEFQARNEKAQIQYVLIKPTDLTSSIRPSDTDLASYFSKNSAKYQIPEKRTVRYALLDLAKLRSSAKPSDDELRAYYNSHIDDYKVENRVHVEHILFKTVGKTDAEIAEIRQKAEGVLKQAKGGASFEDLAKKNSEDDATKPKGGDLGWIIDGQTVPEFQQAAFTVPKGSISDLVKTQYGFHIIKVLDRETAHTKSFEEVRDSILPSVVDAKVDAQANDLSNQIAGAVRQSDRQSLDDLSKKFNLQISEAGPVTVSDPVGELGDSQDVHRMVFDLSKGELSQPIRLDKGIAILTVKDIFPSHQATLAEVHDQVLADYQHDQSLQLAQAKAADLAKRSQGGDNFDKAAKDLGLATKSSDFFARSGSVPDVGTAKQIQGAFTLPLGQVSAPVNLAGNWLVFRVAARNAPIAEQLAAQGQDIEQQLLQNKQEAAYQAFRTGLQDQLKKEGKLVIHTEVLNRFVSSSS